MNHRVTKALALGGFYFLVLLEVKTDWDKDLQKLSSSYEKDKPQKLFP